MILMEGLTQATEGAVTALGHHTLQVVCHGPKGYHPLPPVQPIKVLHVHLKWVLRGWPRAQLHQLSYNLPNLHL